MTAPRGDTGSGAISSLAGVAAFLAFLLLAVHVMLGLYATTIVTDAASAAARRVAGAAVDDEHDAAPRAEATLRAALGRMGDDATIVWEIDDDSVGLTVRVARPGFVQMFGTGEIRRTVTVRRELVR